LEDFITIAEIAARLGISRHGVYQMFHHGLPSVFKGRRRLVPWEAFEQLLQDIKKGKVRLPRRYGPQSEEHKKKIGRAHRGRKWTAERRQQVLDAHRGRSPKYPTWGSK
jgi:excisionase family DNA binding protein